MKVALLTDTHFGCKKGDKNIHLYFQKFYENVFFPTLKQRNIDSVIHLGDIFDVRKNIDFWALKWSHDVVFGPMCDEDIYMTVIVGNHDTYYKNTNSLNSPELLVYENFSNLKIVSEITSMKYGSTEICFIPWINKENYDKTMEFINNTTATIAMGHLEIDGFIAHPGHVHQGGLNRNIFSDKFKKTFSGHFHHKNDDGKIFYLGNTYQMYWNDYGDVRGFHIFDTETHELEFIPNPYNLFDKIFYDDLKTDYFNINFEEYSGKNIKVVVENRKDQAQFEYLISNLQDYANDLKIIETFEDKIEDVDINLEHEDTLTILEKCVDEYEDSIDSNVVKNIIKSLYTEAMDMV